MQVLKEKTPTVWIIAGPTASGKSSLALKKASSNGAIINGDSQQLYQGLPILTAQPTAEAQATLPHYLYSTVPPQHPGISAAQWQHMTHQAIDSICAQDKIPWIVGGTGFYLKTLMEGLSPIPALPPEFQQDFQSRMKDSSLQELYQILFQIDPQLALKLAPTDKQRILRAIAVFEGTGHPLSFWQAQPRKRPPYHFQIILMDPDRTLLHTRIKKRTQAMVETGVINEVHAFHASIGTNPSPLRKAIGLQEISEFIKNHDQNLDQLIERIAIKTQQYAKRQRTWFRHQVPNNKVSLLY